MNKSRMTNAERITAYNLQFAVCNYQFAISNLLFWICFLLANLFPDSISAEEPKKVVIPFDFVSKFDNGRYGRTIGDMIWRKLNREGGFILPESIEDVRDYCQSRHIQPTPDISLDKMKMVIKKDFDAQIGIWGSVERAAGADGEIYDLAIKCVDFSTDPEPKIIYETKSRTNSVSEIPHLYVKQMLDALYHRKSGESYSVDPAAEANWHNNKNLVAGDFQTGANGAPKGWQSVAGQKREPLGGLVQWTADEDNPANKIIRFSFDKSVGDNEGVMYYSDYFPVQEGAKYRFQCRWKSNGPAVKVFIKCYDDLGTPYTEDTEITSASKNTKQPDKDNYLSETSQRREVYRSQQNLKGPKNAWNYQTEDFTPSHTKYSPKWGRVMLYAYLGGGVVEFDDVVVKQIVPPPKNLKKDPKQSQATKVTVKEMEENERRSREAKQK
jgi:hypothetical protein